MCMVSVRHPDRVIAWSRRRVLRPVGASDCGVSSFQNGNRPIPYKKSLASRESQPPQLFRVLPAKKSIEGAHGFPLDPTAGDISQTRNTGLVVYSKLNSSRIPIEIPQAGSACFIYNRDSCVSVFAPTAARACLLAFMYIQVLIDIAHMYMQVR